MQNDDVFNDQSAEQADQMTRLNDLAKSQPVVAIGTTPNMMTTPRINPDAVVTDDVKQAIVERLADGQTLRAIIRDDPALPSYYKVAQARKADAAFDEAVTFMRSTGLENRIEEAIEWQGTVRGNKHLAVAAEKYANVVLKSAAALAPKTLGPMVRHAGADGNDLVVNVVSFADQPTDGGTLDATDAPVDVITKKDPTE